MSSSGFGTLSINQLNHNTMKTEKFIFQSYPELKEYVDAIEKQVNGLTFGQVKIITKLLLDRLKMYKIENKGLTNLQS